MNDEANRRRNPPESIPTERVAKVRLFRTLEGDARRFKLFITALLIGWTCVVAAAGAWNLHEIRREAVEGARIRARTAHFKDVIYRRWNAGHGGVYVPVTKDLQPNPYLSVPTRDADTVNLDRDSAFYLITDGLIHQNSGDKGLPFGRGRVMRFIKESIGRTFEEQQTLLEQLIMKYKGSQPQLDDITVLGFSAQGTIDTEKRD
ncbi:MAG: SpoIIE family protein phosphatase [Pseudomonadota bacterium]